MTPKVARPKVSYSSRILAWFSAFWGTDQAKKKVEGKSKTK
jgi:hypothetical protein